MSIQAATLKRLDFLTSRWEYDIPHKFVWAVDIYGVSKTNIDNVLNQYERRDVRRDWPVAQEISIESVRNQLGFVGLAQEVSFPNESFQIQNMELGQSGGFIQGITGGVRNPYGSQNKIDVTFLENNIDIIDYFLKPWIIAASHKGLIEDGDPNTNMKATIDVYLYARARYRNFVPTLRKHITFHKCVPFFADPDAVSYNDLSYGDLTKTVGFAFERYTINNINAPLFDPIIRQGSYEASPTRPAEYIRDQLEYPADDIGK